MGSKAVKLGGVKHGGVKLGFAPSAVMLHGARAPLRRGQQDASVMAMRVRIEEMRLEHAKLVAEEREKDRELARFRIEERRRLREDMNECERRKTEDEALERELSEGLTTVRERVAKSARELEDAAGEQPTGPMTERDKKLHEEIKQLLAGTWTPPADAG